jgi:hypothetical protein
MVSSLEILIERLRTAKVVALLRDLGPYAAIELLLPGGSLLALGLWMYSRHKSGKPLLPFNVRVPLSAARRLRASSGSAVRRLPGFDFLNRRLRSRNERVDVRVPGVAFGG